MTEVRLDAAFRHPSERVWRALTDRRLLNEWFMRIVSDEPTGTRFRLEPRGLDGFEGSLTAEVVEARAPERLVMTWRADDLYVRVTVAISSTDEGCRLNFVQRGFLGPQGTLRRRALLKSYTHLLTECLPKALEQLAEHDTLGAVSGGELAAQLRAGERGAGARSGPSTVGRAPVAPAQRVAGEVPPRVRAISHGGQVYAASAAVVAPELAQVPVARRSLGAAAPPTVARPSLVPPVPPVPPEVAGQAVGQAAAWRAGQRRSRSATIGGCLLLLVTLVFLLVARIPEALSNPLGPEADSSAHLPRGVVDTYAARDEASERAGAPLVKASTPRPTSTPQTAKAAPVRSAGAPTATARPGDATGADLTSDRIGQWGRPFATYRTNRAGSGWSRGQMMIINPGREAVERWVATLTLPQGAYVADVYRVRYEQERTVVTFTPAYRNRTIPAGGSIEFDVVIKGSGGPTGCTVSDGICAVLPDAHEPY